MVDSSRREYLEDFVIISGLIAFQLVYASYGLLMNYLLSLGLNPLVLVIYASLATSFILAPFAIFFEKELWPKKLNPMLLVQFMLISVGGVTVFQGFMLMGIKNTSPAIASAMPNLAPGFIFIIAWCFKLEKVNLKCTYSRAKILGTLVCLIGALSMSLLQGSSSTMPPPTTQQSLSVQNTISNDKRIVGVMYLLSAIFVLSCTMVLQATTMVEFPAPISLCVITSLMGSIISGVVHVIQEGNLSTGLPSMTVEALIAYNLVGGVVNGITLSFQTWSMKKRGPVLVSMFSPLGTLCSVILTALTLGEAVTLGSMSAMLVMFSGLYLVLWAKRKEGYSNVGDNGTLENQDIEKPLLS